MANKRFFGGVSEFFGDVSRARRAATLYDELSGISDAGLEARGLKRDELPSYAFSRAFGRK